MNNPKELSKNAESESKAKVNALLVNKPEKPKMQFLGNSDLKKRLDMFIPEFKKSTQFLKENPEEAKKLYMDDVDDCENVVEMNVELLDKPSFDKFLSKTESVGEKKISMSVDKVHTEKPSIEVIKPK